MTSSERLNDSEGSCLVPSPRNLQRQTAQKTEKAGKGKEGSRYLQSRPQLRQKVRHRPPFARSANSQATISSPVLFSRMMTALLRKPNVSSSKEYCEDCESYGHTGKHPLRLSFDGTNARDSRRLSTLSRCILASRTTHSLLLPLSRLIALLGS
jgi:hypothetical protein